MTTGSISNRRDATGVRGEGPAEEGLRRGTPCGTNERSCLPVLRARTVHCARVREREQTEAESRCAGGGRGACGRR